MDPKPKISGNREERDLYWHNKGQEDSSKGEYNSPGHGLLNDSDDARDSDKYSEGWRNTADQ